MKANKIVHLMALLLSFECCFRIVNSRHFVHKTDLIFYDSKTLEQCESPTVSVSRGRGLDILKNLEKNSGIRSTIGKPCECKNSVCGCCAGIKVKKYNFDQKVCANVTVVPPKEQALLRVYMNEKASLKYGISVRNPAPFCIPVSMGIPMEMCVQLSDIAIKGNNLNMCMDFIFRLATSDLFEMHFQCMQMGLDGFQYIDKDGNPVIPSGNSKRKHDDDGDGDSLVYDAANENNGNEKNTQQNVKFENDNLAKQQSDSSIRIIGQKTPTNHNAATAAAETSVIDATEYGASSETEYSKRKLNSDNNEFHSKLANIDSIERATTAAAGGEGTTTTKVTIINPINVEANTSAAVAAAADGDGGSLENILKNYASKAFDKAERNIDVEITTAAEKDPVLTYISAPIEPTPVGASKLL